MKEISQMEENKNIQLTVVRPDNEESDEIDLFAIFGWVKKFFALWLTLAVVFGGIALAVGIWSQNVVNLGNAEAFITFSNGAKDKGIDINLLSSAQVVSDAMRECNVDLMRVDQVRTNIKIASVMSDEANDRKTLYSTLLTKSGNLEVADALLESGNGTTGYIVAFDYKAAGFNRDQGIELLNAVLSSYRDYVQANYNFNDTIGSSVAVLDYHDYDYSEAVSIFSDTLDRIDSYLANAKAADQGAFRSQKTGYTFGELQEVSQMIRDVELDQANAYIVLNSVTANGGDAEIAHYRWLIEELERKKSVEQTRLEALTNSIETYEKDPVVYALESTVINPGDDYYDSLLSQKLDAQQTISGYDRTISYYELLIKGYRGSGVSAQAKCEQADRYLATLNDKVNRIITDIKETSEEFYSKASFNATVNIRVTAIAPGPSLTGRSVLMIVGIAEGILILIYLGAACVCGIKESVSSKKK